MAFAGGKRRLLLILVGMGFIAKLLSLPGTVIQDTTKSDHDSSSVLGPHIAIDDHPISKLMTEADGKWREYEGCRSMAFKETVSKYRTQYGRHPPPGFPEWYKYAQDRNVYNIDDFDQIMDDLRPFWAVEPRIIRTLAAHMWENSEDGIAGIHIRDKKIAKESNGSWRSETLITLIERFIEYLPDMDIAINRLDQPRVVVPWEDMQKLLQEEVGTRQMLPEAYGDFTQNMSGLLDTIAEVDDSPREDAGWYGAAGRQYMEIAKTACPPESHAREGNNTQIAAEAQYKNRLGGVITNFNLSSDLCTIGPEIQDKHGFLFSASSISATERLVPLFGECKVNVNSDILFPANMYWKQDNRYNYDDRYDLEWPDKEETLIWRGVTSGGVQVPENWRRLHRQRLVLSLNATEMQDQDVRILTSQPESPGEYENYRQFKPSKFAEKYTDVGFTEASACFPNCTYIYDHVLSFKPQISQAEQFRSKYLVDVDGHSFSGRWRAFLESRSLGIKATIFREWHDSRLFAWRHFVPLDNRFDDLYTILTYFIGLGSPENTLPGEPYVARHDLEARRIAQQGREWANTVLRRDDIEVCPQGVFPTIMIG